MTFHDFVAETLGTRSWAVFRNTRHRNATAYERPLTFAEFDRLKDAFVAAGGDPADIGRRPGVGAAA